MAGCDEVVALAEVEVSPLVVVFCLVPGGMLVAVTGILVVVCFWTEVVGFPDVLVVCCFVVLGFPVVDFDEVGLPLVGCPVVVFKVVG